jgi:hypothetical protein
MYCVLNIRNCTNVKQRFFKRKRKLPNDKNRRISIKTIEKSFQFYYFNSIRENDDGNFLLLYTNMMTFI